MNASFSTVSPEGSVEVSPKNKVFAYGDNVTLNCGARGGPGNLFSWYYNDISVGYTQMLTIVHFTISDALTYECRVDNPAGSGTDTTQLYLELLEAGKVLLATWFEPLTFSACCC